MDYVPHFVDFEVSYFPICYKFHQSIYIINAEIFVPFNPVNWCVDGYPVRFYYANQCFDNKMECLLLLYLWKLKNSEKTAQWMSAAFCIYWDLSQCHLSVTADNFGQMLLGTIIKNMWSVTVLSMVDGNGFNQVILIYISICYEQLS